ncbi:MAG: hypothetical protein LBR79_06555 [Oscillospiraceae bacterium]|nr:hypothetical protein [Oscillospiraceae bacterium]
MAIIAATFEKSLNAVAIGYSDIFVFSPPWGRGKVQKCHCFKSFTISHRPAFSAGR